MSLAELANSIQNHLDEIVNLWVNAVRSDESIKSDADLSDGGLINHVPVMIEEMCRVLRSGQRPQGTNINEARVHAFTRFRQGYRARDLIRETTLLRLTLSEFLTNRFLSDHRAGEFESLLDALRTINLYIDEELRYAVSIYTEGSKANSTARPC
ncbi:MAG TPA: RsbRD N-terminal domain-containing protein [Pyrinomonadaceae bacterium]|jgi:hypothetical protein